VDIDMADPDDVFTLTPTGKTQAVISDIDDGEGKRRPHTASVIVNVGEAATFNVNFKPSSPMRSQAHVRLTVVNNQYEDSVIQLVGEGYEDDITLDHIHSIIQPVDPEQEEGNMAEDDVPAAKHNLIRFGDCLINEPRTLTFCMTNHSAVDCVRFVWPEHPQLKFSPQVGHLHPKTFKDMSVTFKSDSSKTLQEHQVPCKVTKITFDKSTQEVADWDDRLRTVKWVDVAHVPSATTSEGPGNAVPGGGKPQTPTLQAPAQPVVPPTPATRSAKKKVVEIEPEPAFSEVTDSTRNVDMLITAISDYSKYKCKTEAIHFRDTLMFQTRVFEFHLSNKGNIAMDYNWQILMDTFASPGPRSVTFAATEMPESRPGTANALAVRPGSATSHIRPDSAASSMISETAYTPFSIEPHSGSILAGKKATFKVKFSPLDVQEYEGRIICSIPNLEEGKQGPVVGFKGRSLMPYCHFELEASDYISSARRNPELRGPGGAPPGTTLDPNTRVIEFQTVGICVRNTKKFHIVNPTNQRYMFVWMNEDELNAKKLPDFTCSVTEGDIRSGKKTEVSFEFTSSQLGLVESFWKFMIPEAGRAQI
jgi:hydrocephalus-inducing protein